MTVLPDFDIKSFKPISAQFIAGHMLTFKQAALFVSKLPYGRNTDKNNLISLFTENRGTCSTKHALLKQLADENEFKGLQLTIGMFKMNEKNTPAVSMTLKLNKLEHIPEAHCYLKYNGLILDYTKPNSCSLNFTDDLMEEIEISPDQITDYKISYHKNYLRTWLDTTEHIEMSFSDLWTIREQCIESLMHN